MEVVYEFFNNDDLIYFLVIPFFSGFVGLTTNYIGIKMMFSPLEFVGIKPIFGWQGIVPVSPPPSPTDRIGKNNRGQLRSKFRERGRVEREKTSGNRLSQRFGVTHPTGDASERYPSP